jgi:hypothetical protein
MQLRKEYRILITLNCPSPILKSSISKLLKIRTKSISINSEVPLVVV